MTSDCSVFVGNSDLTFKNAVGVGAIRGKEFHEYHEILLFINGNVEFFSEKIHTILSPDSIVIIPKESYHQFIIKSDEESYRRCVFNFYSIPMLEDSIKKCMREVAIVTLTPRLKLLFEKAIEISVDDLCEDEKLFILSSVLSIIVSELSTQSHQSLPAVTYNAVVISCVEYVNAHLCEPLSISDIAKHLNVSVSSLTHSFKRDMNISLYRYILKKRLVLAEQKILAGESAQKTALDCGFGDYSGFYKQYKKTFGTAPSEKNRGQHTLN